MTRVFLSIGSNLGNRVEHLRGALYGLMAVNGIRLLDVSRLYETEPWESTPGQIVNRACWFLNCVAAIETTLAPDVLLDRVQQIESDLGRVRSTASPEAARYEPRTLDIDILLYGEQVVSAPDDLHIPHLLMHERGFVLRPLADLAPDVEHPILYQTIRELLETLEDDHQVVPADLPRHWFQP
ncbi:MAG: 2-amino-4-hydroxy-6-hydroxymethyldihydropteridine diphosphokinase [Candidatus Rokubacteria bacterium]|nr:2-amino-4-hydroxy-6-hydroxymethyldihydropteridine diphosphokinase [Candidatus Rokubacteria bacterium]